MWKANFKRPAPIDATSYNSQGTSTHRLVSAQNATEQMPVSRKQRGSVEHATIDPWALRLALSASNSSSLMIGSSPREYAPMAPRKRVSFLDSTAYSEPSHARSSLRRSKSASLSTWRPSK